MARTTTRPVTLVPAVTPVPSPSASMEVALTQDALKKGLSAVLNAVNDRAVIPVLKNALLEAEGSSLRLAATNQDIAVVCEIPAEVVAPGAVTLPARLLSDWVNRLPNATVILTLDDASQTVQAVCARIRSSIKGIAADEYPAIPSLCGLPAWFSVAAGTLRAIIAHVADAATSDATRPVLQGVLLRTRGLTATWVATDGFRLAMHTLQLWETAAKDEDVIIPARSLLELSKILKEHHDDDQVEVALNPNGAHILFHVGTTDFLSRLIEGRYPDYERILPAQHTTRVSLPTAALLPAVKRAALFATCNRHAVRLTMMPGAGDTPGTLILSAAGTEVGDNVEALEATVTGEALEIALNSKFIEATIDAFRGETCIIETTSKTACVVIHPEGHDATHGSIALVMPMTP